MKRFETGKTYQTRSVCDHDCIIAITIKKRTPKTLVTSTGDRLRIKPSYCGQYETVMPWGRYSMAPCITAEDPQEAILDAFMVDDPLDDKDSFLSALAD